MSNTSLSNERRIASDNISQLGENEVFVFGSNIQGSHGGGAAWYAYKNFGAVWGQGEGLQGQSYGLPTMEGMTSMKSAVKRFTDFARVNSHLTFLVTAVGCGIAGYSPIEVAPLFSEAAELENVYLPKVFVDLL